MKRMEPQRQRFALRKLTVGVASVLLGVTFFVGGAQADADTPTTPATTGETTGETTATPAAAPTVSK